jgi:putative peptidoglycan lipid II flippase
MIFKGFPLKDFPELIFLTRVLLLSPILLGLSNFFGSITQVYKRFVIYSISPMVYNLGIIFGLLALQPIFGLRGVVYGVILGALFHLLIQIPFVIKQGLFPKFKVNFDWPEIKKVMILSVPRTFTLGIAQITTIFLIAMATFMKDGSVAIFNFSINNFCVIRHHETLYLITTTPACAGVAENPARPEPLFVLVAAPEFPPPPPLA